LKNLGVRSFAAAQYDKNAQDDITEAYSQGRKNYMFTSLNIKFVAEEVERWLT
jgi:hypothetical protein